MNADFLDAHDRHWDDAERLYGAQRWANADHLYGMATECGLKGLMLVFGMPFDAAKDKPVEKADQVHVDGAWLRFETYRCGHHAGARYLLSASSPFADWHVSQRYAHQSHFNQARVDPHRQGADQVRQLVKKAAVEGLL